MLRSVLSFEDQPAEVCIHEAVRAVPNYTRYGSARDMLTYFEQLHAEADSSRVSVEIQGHDVSVASADGLGTPNVVSVTLRDAMGISVALPGGIESYQRAYRPSQRELGWLAVHHPELMTRVGIRQLVFSDQNPAAVDKNGWEGPVHNLYDYFRQVHMEYPRSGLDYRAGKQVAGGAAQPELIVPLRNGDAGSWIIRSGSTGISGQRLAARLAEYTDKLYVDFPPYDLPGFSNARLATGVYRLTTDGKPATAKLITAEPAYMRANAIADYRSTDILHHAAISDSMSRVAQIAETTAFYLPKLELEIDDAARFINLERGYDHLHTIYQALESIRQGPNYALTHNELARLAHFTFQATYVLGMLTALAERHDSYHAASLQEILAEEADVLEDRLALDAEPIKHLVRCLVGAVLTSAHEVSRQITD